MTGDTAMTLNKASDRPDASQYSSQREGNSPCRDISWHPYFPVIASTEFNGNVNIWTMQNINQTEKDKIREQNTKQEQPKEKSEDDDDGTMGLGRGGTTLIRGANGQVYRVPVSVLMNLLREQEAREAEDTEEEEVKAEKAESDGPEDEEWDDTEELLQEQENDDAVLETQEPEPN